MLSPVRPLSRLGLVVLVLALSVSLVSPASAARQRPTSITGWSTSVLDVVQGQTVTATVRVRPASQRVVRRVSLQQRSGGAAWRTVASSRTNAQALATLRFVASTTAMNHLRVVVAPTRRARGLTSPVRIMMVNPPTSGVVTGAEMSELEAEVLRLTNEARGQARTCGTEKFAAVGPLRAEPALTAASRAHARDMAVQNYFSHTSKDGRSVMDRALGAGYRTNGIGENIAWGQTTPRAVVDAWLKSVGHCKNLMRSGWVDLGVGHATTAQGRAYWVQMFGTGRVVK